MCRRVTCEKCNKPTYAGCGAHIEMVLGDVAKEQRCRCREAKAVGRRFDAHAGHPRRRKSVAPGSCDLGHLGLDFRGSPHERYFRALSQDTRRERSRLGVARGAGL